MSYTKRGWEELYHINIHEGMMQEIGKGKPRKSFVEKLRNGKIKVFGENESGDWSTWVVDLKKKK
jgi:hypothetical protein